MGQQIGMAFLMILTLYLTPVFYTYLEELWKHLGNPRLNLHRTVSNIHNKNRAIGSLSQEATAGSDPSRKCSF
jgi:hypothetical protein